MRDHIRARRIAEEVLMLALQYGEVQFDEEDGRWVMLPRFPLPPRLGRATCALLIELPPAYPAVPPFGVYIDRDLAIQAHYFPETGQLNQYADEGWAWLCLHEPRDAASTWRPGLSAACGDSLVVVLALVHALLEESP